MNVHDRTLSSSQVLTCCANELVQAEVIRRQERHKVEIEDPTEGEKHSPANTLCANGSVRAPEHRGGALTLRNALRGPAW